MRHDKDRLRYILVTSTLAFTITVAVWLAATLHAKSQYDNGRCEPCPHLIDKGD